jgi:GT2 family glycosyltransferase
VKKAKGQFVYIIGSDFVLEPMVVEEAVEKCVVDGYDAICVHNTSDPSVSFWSKVRKLERDCYRDDELNVAARFLKKSVCESIGGFDESLIAAEDYDVHNRLLRAGYKIGRINAQEVHIGEPKSLWEIAKKHYYYGKTIGEYIRKSPKKARKQLSPIRLSYLRHWKDFLKHPVLTIVFIFYQFVRYTASFFGFVVASSSETIQCKTKGKE